MRCEVTIPIPNSRRRAALASSMVCLTNSRGAIWRSRPGCDSTHFVPGKEASADNGAYVLQFWPAGQLLLPAFWASGRESIQQLSGLLLPPLYL